MKNKYFLKKKETETYQDVTTLFDGVKILKVEGFLERGKPLNVYHQQWNDSQSEDYMVCSEDGRVVYENKDINISFVVSDKYATSAIDVVRTHENFIDYMTKGETFIMSKYTNMMVRAAFIGEYKPTMVRLHREKSYILGTITLHKLDKEQPIR